MAYISHKKLWEREFDNIVSKRNKLQVKLQVNQLKREVHDSYKKMKNKQEILKLLMTKML